ncbi:hypothetical protein [Streptomyces chumphonensis]|uniref:hypothetical protein n=1 Tax=Streptomyces chumphonensis TaxID=1214925 RepID=UPI003D753C2A
MTTATTISLGCLALSLAILYANFRPWWKGGRDPKALLPFAQAWLLGALSTICVGGLLGWLSGCTRQGGNTIGDKAIGGATGADSAPLTGATMGELTPEGAVVVALLTVGVGLAWKAVGKADKRRMAGGAFCGATQCVTAGVADALGWLPTTVNAAGEWGRALFEGGVSL